MSRLLRVTFISILSYWLIGSLVVGCKTTDVQSDLESWKIDGSVEKAESFIISTVLKTYPKINKKDAELKRFAESLMNRKNIHSETQDYILNAKSAQGHAELQRYIVTEFATSTNIFEVLDSGADLQFLGPADQYFAQ